MDLMVAFLFAMISAMSTAKAGPSKWTLGMVGTLYVLVFAVIAVTSYEPPTYKFNDSGPILLAGVLGVMVTVLWRGRAIGRLDWILPGALMLLALCSFPDTSRDPLRYLLDGEMIRLWHLSPFVHPPGEFPLDQYGRAFVGHWQALIPSPYGPVWQGLMALINFVSGNQLVGGIVALKIVNLAGLVACGWYMYRITGKAWTSYLFLINPIVLLNTVATPHPDIVMAAALLAAYYYHQAAVRGALIGLAGLVKIHALIFMPFFGRRGRDFWLVGASTAVTVAGLMVASKPLLNFDWLAMVRAGHGGGVVGMDSLLMYGLMPSAPRDTIFMASYGLFLTGYAAIAVAFVRGKLSSLSALIFTSFLVPFCLTGVLLPWHFIIPLGFLLLSERRPAFWVVLFLTLLALRSALRMPEVLLLGALFAGGGWVIYQAFRRVENPPGWAIKAVALLR